MNNPEILKQKVLNEINYLREHRRGEITPDIDAVWVLAGAGTYFKPTKNSEPEWARWQDRDRIRFGVALVREITAAKMRDLGIDPDKKGYYVTKEEIEKHGPYFIYNGTPEENVDFEKAAKSPYSVLPWGKVRLITDFNENGETAPISNTLDQFKSLPDDLFFGKKRIIKNKLAVVSNAEHHSRNRRYFPVWVRIPKPVKTGYFAIPTRDGQEQFAQQEADKVVLYNELGHLAYEPIENPEKEAATV